MILSPPLDGATNMAIDKALFSLSKEPTLRFYSWSRPTLSIGYFQKVNISLLNNCRKKGIDVVRRPTGGRAVLHDDEVTYSIISTYNDFPGSSSLHAIYQFLAEWQVASLAKIGVNASLSTSTRSLRQGYTSKDSCFLTTIPSEVVVKGKKICGSAQKRGYHSFLQHGSIPLSLNEEQFLDITGENKRALQSFTTLSKEGYAGTSENFVSILSFNFEAILDCQLHRSNILSTEWDEIRTLQPSASL